RVFSFHKLKAFPGEPYSKPSQIRTCTDTRVCGVSLLRRAGPRRSPVNLVEKRCPRGQSGTMQSVFTGPVFVVRDNIDTDQIIPAQFLNLVPTIAEEYEKLGSFA